MMASRFAVLPALPASAPEWLPQRPAAPVRCWKVTHACEASAPLLPVAQAQIEAGMRAAFLTPHSLTPPLSAAPASSRLAWRHPAAVLLQTCRDVRRWRHLLAAEAVSDAGEILHTHCLAAGLAAALGDDVLVYDLHDSVTRLSGPYMLRLLRTAEKFALARAAAVVVHSRALWGEALRLGVRTEDLFLVPDPVDLEPYPSGAGAPHLPVFGRRGSIAPPVVLFAPDVASEAELSTILEAFGMLAAEVDGAELLVEADGELAAFAMRQALEVETASAVRVVAPADRPRALAAADIVIASPPCRCNNGSDKGGPPNDEQPSRTAIVAFAHGRTLLAADVAPIREVTPQGSGCIWYRAGHARDLAYRAAFLARNADFRAALAASGRAHLAATRGPAAVARLYDDVYRHAWRKRPGGPDDIVRQLQAVQAPL